MKKQAPVILDKTGHQQISDGHLQQREEDHQNECPLIVHDLGEAKHLVIALNRRSHPCEFPKDRAMHPPFEPR